MVEFSDPEDIEHWLQDKPREVAVALAARAALRSLPGIGRVGGETFREIALPVVRATLVSAVASVDPTAEAEIREAALSAARSIARSTARSAAHSAAFSSTRSAAESAARSAANSSAFSTARSVTDSSRSAAFLAPDSARSAADFAAGVDADMLGTASKVTSVFRTALWPVETGGWAWSDFAQPLFDAFDAEPAIWGFWARWYWGFLEGAPLGWDLQEAVALIPDEVWTAGPERVAERIREIERGFRQPPLDQDKLAQHLRTLATEPTGLHADAALGAASLVEETIARFKREAPANVLPEGFEQFEKLPGAFRGIAQAIGISGSTPDVNKLQDEVNSLHGIIADLRAELRDANDALREARLTKVEAAQMRTFGERLQTTLTNVTLIGTISLGLANFFGISAEDLQYDAFKKELQSLSDEMREATPAPEEVGSWGGQDI